MIYVDVTGGFGLARAIHRVVPQIADPSSSCASVPVRDILGPLELYSRA